MKIIETALPGVLVLEPRLYTDERGYFLELLREEALRAHLPAGHFVQENGSRSRRGVLRGLHFQWPHAQGKLVQVTRGAVFDVVVDVRRASPDFGRWHGLVLDDVAHRQLYVPPGFAHGFLTLSESADVLYHCTDYYHPEAEQGIAWDDPDLGIAWPDAGVELILSDKDKQLPRVRALGPDRLPEYPG